MSQRFSTSGSPGALPWLICFLALSTSHTVNSVSVIPSLCRTGWTLSRVVSSAGVLDEAYPSLRAETGTSDQINTMWRILVGKVPEGFAQVLARCSSLAQTKYMTRHNAAVIELYFDGNAKGPQACRLFSSLVLTSGAQPVVPVRRRSSILRCSCLRRAHTWLIGDLLTTRRWVWWLWKWAVHDWTTARRRILRRQRSTKHCGGSLLGNTQSTRSWSWTSSLTFCRNSPRS